MSKLLRALVIGSILVGGFWVGEWLRPNRAEADVYLRVEIQVSSLLDFLRLDGRLGGKRLLEVNGNRLYSQLSTSSQTPQEILDTLDARAGLEYAAMEIPVDREALENGLDLTFHFRRPFRYEGEGWGVFGRLTAGPLEPLDSILGPLAKGRGLGPSGAGGFVLLALRAPEQRETDVWTIRFDERFDPLAFAGPRDADVAGGDIPGIQRFPGSRRIMRLSESSVAGVTHGVAYAGGGSIGQHLRHFDGVFRRMGLRPGPPVGGPDGTLTRYLGKGLEVSVFIDGSAGFSSEIIDLIQVRNTERTKS